MNNNKTFQPLAYINAGFATIVTSAESYVREVLHDAQAVKAVQDLNGFWSIDFKTNIGWRSASRGRLDSEEEAWESTYQRFWLSGETGSDDANFEDEQSIADIIKDIATEVELGCRDEDEAKTAIAFYQDVIAQIRANFARIFPSITI